MIHAESLKTKVLSSSPFGADYTTNDDFCLKSPCKQTHHTSELELNQTRTPFPPGKRDNKIY